MKRRALLAAAATPLVFPARAAVPPIGWVSVEPPGAVVAFLGAFKKGLDAAYPGAQPPKVIERHVAPDPAAIAAAVKELQEQGVGLIVSQGGASVLVVQAKPTVPVVFAFSGDPVVAGMVESLARPGGNVTGMSFMALELNIKRIGFARDLVPNCRKVALLSNRRHPGEEREIAVCQEAVAQVGIELSVHRLLTAPEATAAIGEALDRGAEAVLTLPSAGMLQHVPAFVAACAPRKVPLIGGWTVFAQRGAVLTYGPDLADCYRRVARYVSRVLGGSAPSTLPVELPTSFELAVNKQAATGLGMTLPMTLLAQANEVIE